MTKPAIVILIVWAAGVMAGIRWLNPRRAASGFATDALVQYLASRRLPKNHRVIAADIVVPANLPLDLADKLPARSSLEGFYVKSDIGAGKPVTSDQVSPAPDLAVDKTQRLFTYSLEGKPLAGDSGCGNGSHGGRHGCLSKGSRVRAGRSAEGVCVLCGFRGP
jgi:hypothetical protein